MTPAQYPCGPYEHRGPYRPGATAALALSHKLTAPDEHGTPPPPPPPDPKTVDIAWPTVPGARWAERALAAAQERQVPR